MSCPWCGRSVLPRQPVVIEWNPEAAEDALRALATRSLDWVEIVFGDAMHAIAGCIRGLYDAAPGHDLISTDYNSIEAVGLAMISGEQWRIEVFRSHGKIYETSAAMMYRIPFEEFAKHKAEHGQHHPLRQKGKIGELAFGYQGWLGAAQAFDMPGTEDEIKTDILAWRRASPSVEWLWGGQTLGKAAGILSADVASARLYLQAGAQFVAVGVDTSLLVQAALQLCQQFSPVGPAAAPVPVAGASPY